LKTIGFISPELKRLKHLSSDALILYRFAEMKPLRGIASLVDWRLYGHLSRLILDGFFIGDEGESLVMPLRRHLGPHNLLILGLGVRAEFGENRFCSVLTKTFEILNNLHLNSIAIALPGRVEQLIDGEIALSWFLDLFGNSDEDRIVHLVEPAAEQKAMIPVAERWRLKQLIE
jgi:hypothetical protein